MNPRFFIFILTATLGMGGAALAQTALEPVAGQVRTEALSLPADVPLVVISPADAGYPRMTYTIHRTFQADGTFTAEWKSPRYQSTQTYLPDGTLVLDREADLVRKTVFEQKVAPGRTSVQTTITVDGSVKSDKKSDLKPGVVLRGELDHIVRQAWLYGIRDGLKIQSLSPDGGMTGDAQILFTATSDPLGLSAKYTYPAEFKEALGSRNGYIVADLSLQGIAAFFFPHHFYLVYVERGPALDFVAYFGEDPKNPTFQWVVKN